VWVEEAVAQEAEVVVEVEVEEGLLVVVGVIGLQVRLQKWASIHLINHAYRMDPFVF